MNGSDIMPYRQQISKDIEAVKKAMETTESKSEFRRLQCVYLGDTKPKMTAKEIAGITLFTEINVKKIHVAFRQNGLDSIKDNRGGRYRENLTIKQEEELLKEFEEQSVSGKLVEASKIKLEYEKLVGKKVNKTVIYRMLERHGFRKIVPYKRHPKSNTHEQEAFKKTFLK
jgi:transposase